MLPHSRESLLCEEKLILETKSESESKVWSFGVLLFFGFGRKETNVFLRNILLIGKVYIVYDISFLVWS